MKEHVSILISGKVQGVFFRAFAKEKADELGVMGFVRNQPDGCVYLEAEGEKASLQELETWCRRGSPRAHVESIEVMTGELKGFSGFVVRK